jgi:hypothetical protein
MPVVTPSNLLMADFIPSLLEGEIESAMVFFPELVTFDKIKSLIMYYFYRFFTHQEASLG